MRVLIIGGTSGLGLSLAKQLVDESSSHEVVVTGRHDPGEARLQYLKIDLCREDAIEYLIPLLYDTEPFDAVIYAAGMREDGTIDELGEKEIDNMISVGLAMPTRILKYVLKSQGQLDTFIAVTSTSQITPRLREPLYTAVKAALGMLAKSLAEDPRIGRVLVAAPAGMDTQFWAGSDRETGDFLDPEIVARAIWELYEGDYTYALVKLLRGGDPLKVEIVEMDGAGD